MELTKPQHARGIAFERAVTVRDIDVTATVVEKLAPWVGEAECQEDETCEF